jgi:hypothetical protein
VLVIFDVLVRLVDVAVVATLTGMVLVTGGLSGCTQGE